MDTSSEMAQPANVTWKFSLRSHSVRLFCDYHLNFLEWFGDDEETEHPFDATVWHCRGMLVDQNRIHRLQDAIDEHVGRAQAMPDYPPGGYKKIAKEYWPEDAKEEHGQLELELDKIRNECRNSWQLVIEETK
jgi:hypothetical protein